MSPLLPCETPAPKIAFPKPPMFAPPPPTPLAVWSLFNRCIQIVVFQTSIKSGQVTEKQKETERDMMSETFVGLLQLKRSATTPLFDL